MSEKEVDLFIEDFLAYANLVRKEYGAPPLTLSNKLCYSAQNRAKLLINSKSRELKEHFLDISENVITLYDNVLDAEMIIGDWLSEANKYDFTKPTYNARCSRFTSLVWINARNLGVGFHYDIKFNKICVVVRFNPATNYMDQFTKNVFPKGSEIKKRLPNRVLPISNVPEKDLMVKMFLQYHNQKRQAHNSPELTLNDELCTLAEASAKMLLYANIHDETDFNQHPDLGTNSCFCVGGIMAVKDIFDLWYECKSPHDYNLNKFQSVSASFCQIVWKETKSFGIGMIAKSKYFACVALYDPPGNVEDKYSENVFPAKKEEN